MKIARLRQPALSALAILVISGAGIAFAGNDQSAAPAPIAPTVVPSAVSPAEPVEPVEPVGPDTDTLQEGDQTTPDSPADEAAEAAEAPGVETETAGAEEPGDAALPGGGHADDPNDPNADHQFEGVE